MSKIEQTDVEGYIALKAVKERDGITGQRVGYRRVSTVEQNLARQDLGPLDELFEDKLSGMDRQRPGLQEMIRHVRKGDEVVVWSSDRLARKFTDIEGIIEEINAKGASVRFLNVSGSPMVFRPGRQDDTQRLFFRIIAAVQDHELAVIKQRQREGQAAAKAAGKYRNAGRKPTVVIDLEQARQLQHQGMSISAISKQLEVNRATLWKALNPQKAQEARERERIAREARAAENSG